MLLVIDKRHASTYTCFIECLGRNILGENLNYKNIKLTITPINSMK